MNMIELHILQSFPVTCLNRDDLGAPKSALFGGVQRARVSSQCWKRAIRELASNDDSAKDFFAGRRTRYVVQALEKAYQAKGADAARAKALAVVTADAVGKLDDPEKGNVKTLLFFSPQELDAVADAVWALDLDPKLLADCVGEDKKKAEKAIKETIIRVKAYSIEEATKKLDPTDIQGLQRLMNAKKALQDLQKLHISIN